MLNGCDGGKGGEGGKREVGRGWGGVGCISQQLGLIM